MGKTGQAAARREGKGALADIPEVHRARACTVRYEHLPRLPGAGSPKLRTPTDTPGKLVADVDPGTASEILVHRSWG